MKYLSDLLYVDIPTHSFKGYNKTYNVYVVIPYLQMEIDNVPSFHTNNRLIYTGNVYGTGSNIRIYLNDIISTYVYDNSYVYNHIDNNKGFIGTSITDPVIFESYVTVEDVGTYYVVPEDDVIMSYYKDAKTVAYRNIRPLYTSYPETSYNPLMQRTYVLPRIPRLPYSTNNFWVSGMLASNIGWIGANTNTYDEFELNVVGLKEDNTVEVNGIQSFYTETPINAVTLKGDVYEEIVRKANKIAFAGVPHDGEARPTIPIATIDDCPAEYYLIWIDRTGAYQCQPFKGKNVLSESVSTSYITNMTDIKKVINKNITNEWTLNSGWLTEDQYKAYESIFTSKYVYLFNTEYDDGYEVILDTNKWTEKTKNNRDKMFNLTITVKAAQNQNIIY